MGTIREYKKSDGSISYNAEVRLRGHSPQRDTFRTRTAAKKWIQDTESAIRDGRHFKYAEAKKHSLGELIDRFISQWLVKFPKRKAKQSLYLNWWKEKLGHLLLSDVTPSILAESRDCLLAESTNRHNLRSPSTVNRYLAAMSKALSVAVQEWGWLDSSPMQKVSKPQEAPARERFLSEEEKENLLQACRESVNPFLYPLVALSILTAMRFGELITLKWEDIDFKLDFITLRETKNGDRRVIPLTQAAISLFKMAPTWQENSKGYIFRSDRRNNKSGLASVRKAFETALKKAGIENFRWHDLRHTAASYLAMNGATQGELMAILGHRSPHMTRRYAHYSQQHIRTILVKSNNQLLVEVEDVE